MLPQAKLTRECRRRWLLYSNCLSMSSEPSNPGYVWTQTERAGTDWVDWGAHPARSLGAAGTGLPQEGVRWSWSSLAPGQYPAWPFSVGQNHSRRQFPRIPRIYPLIYSTVTLSRAHECSNNSREVKAFQATNWFLHKIFLCTPSSVTHWRATLSGPRLWPKRWYLISPSKCAHPFPDVKPCSKDEFPSINSTLQVRSVQKFLCMHVSMLIFKSHATFCIKAAFSSAAG